MSASFAHAITYSSGHAKISTACWPPWITCATSAVLPLVDCHAVSSPWTVWTAMRPLVHELLSECPLTHAGDPIHQGDITPIPHKRRWPNLDSHPTTLRRSIWDSSDLAARPSTHLREHAATLPQEHTTPYHPEGLSSTDIAFKLMSHRGVSHHTFLGLYNLSVPTYLRFCLFLFDFSWGDMNRPI